MSKNNSRVLKQACNAIWAMPEGKLLELLEIASRHKSDPESAAKIKKERGIQLAATGFAYVPGTSGSYLSGEGVAIMGVSGPLFKKAGLFEAISGATSVEMLMDDFRMLMANDAVKGILLDIDSPGGEVAGTEELAELIFQARGIKPVDVYFSGWGCSGALWVGSGARHRTSGRSSVLGSVGVKATFIDTSKLDAEMGIEEITILSSNASKKNPDPATPEGAEQILATLNALETVFISTLARNYGVTSETVINTFGQGDIMTGDQALEIGMIDAIGFRAEALKYLSDSVAGTSTSGTPQASSNGKIKMETNPTPQAGATTPPENTVNPLAGVSPVIRERLATSFIATRAVEDRLLPESRKALLPLHMAAQSAGMDEQLETFVLGLKPTSLTGEAIPAVQAAKTKVAVETAKGQVNADADEVDALVKDANEPTAEGETVLQTFMKSKGNYNV